MRYRVFAMAIGSLGLIVAAALAQGPGNPGGTFPQGANPTVQVNVEKADLNLVFPDRYAVPVVLEPNRKIFLMAPTDGVLKSVATPVGAEVRENQEIAQLDRAEAAARVKIAEASVKEAQAEAARAEVKDAGVTQARLEGAKARAELAHLELDRCTLRAPFAGKVIAAPVAPGQYVTKGNMLAELADLAVLKVLVPVDRTLVQPNQNVELVIEGRTVAGKVSALVPLPEAYAALRELAVPWAGAWVNLPSGGSDGVRFEPGQRVRSPYLPTEPITALPARAVRGEEGQARTIQVVRAGYVLDIPVQVLGDAGFGRIQVAGGFEPNDAAIVESSSPLAAGAVVRFREGPPVSGAVGGNVGSIAEMTPPVGGPAMASPGRVAPIGSPNANMSRPGSPRAGVPKVGATKAAPRSTTKPARPPGTANPF